MKINTKSNLSNKKKTLILITRLLISFILCAGIVFVFNYLVIINNDNVEKQRKEYISKTGANFKSQMESNFSYLMDRVAENEVTDIDDRFSLATKRAIMINIGEEAKTKSLPNEEKANKFIDYYTSVSGQIESKLAMLNSEIEKAENGDQNIKESNADSEQKSQ